MPILFMMPYWQAPSEVWLQRMIEQLQDEIVLIAANDAQSHWNNKIPGFCMRPPKLPMCWWQRRIQKIKNTIIPEPSLEEKLARYAKSLGVTKVLIHYAHYALQMRSLFKYLDAQLFIHCHGYDTSFHGLNYNYPHQPLHHDSYVDDLLALPGETIFIANSKYTARVLKDFGISDKNISLKYFGVEVDDIYPERKIKDKISILYLGRFIDCKGPDLTIDAFNLARDKGLNAELIMAGEGSLIVTCELKRLESKYAEDIHLLGSVTREEAEKLYHNADIYTMHNRLGPLTNREEAFGVSILEAMASGLPVVTGKSGGVMEIVVDGETGILLMPGDVKAQAKAFIELFSDPQLRREMGEAGWRRVKACFSQENEKAEMLKLLGLK